MVDNQHPLITGYRQLGTDEVAAINAIKALGNEVGQLIEALKANGKIAPDPRALALARTEIQTGFMWLVRSIAKPDGFV